MIRNKLPWLFAALALISPLVLFGAVGGWTLDYTGRFLFFFYSLFLIAWFLTGAAAIWSPRTVASRSFRRAVLVPSGVGSLVIGVGVFILAAVVWSEEGAILRAILTIVGVSMATTAAVVSRQLVVTSAHGDENAITS